MDRWKQGQEGKGRVSVPGLQQLPSRLSWAGGGLTTPSTMLGWEGSVPAAYVGEVSDLMLSLRSC